jgi:hypothetical protein
LQCFSALEAQCARLRKSVAILEKSDIIANEENILTPAGTAYAAALDRVPARREAEEKKAPLFFVKDRGIFEKHQC